MIVSCDISGENGAAYFMRRLSKFIPIVSHKSNAHIHILGPHGHIRKGLINVMRLDGVYYDVKRIPMNRQIYKTAKKCDAIIYQSEWSKTMFRKMCGTVDVPSTIIYNGSDLKPSSIKNRRGFDRVFACSASWRPNKRLSSIRQAFSIVRKNANVGLFVAGANIDQEGVVCFGSVPNSNIGSLYNDCDYMIHVSHMESCSNSVVEALCCGLPVLSNNIGGTPEIVGDSGIIIDLDKEFDFKPVKSMEAVGDVIDTNKIAEGMIRMMSMEWKIHRSDLAIECIGQKYVSFLEKLI